jgi:hypothetical protein
MWKHSLRKMCQSINAWNKSVPFLIRLGDRNWKGQDRNREKICLIHTDNAQVFISLVCFPQHFTVYSKYTNATPCKATESLRFLAKLLKTSASFVCLTTRPSTCSHRTTRFLKDEHKWNCTLRLLLKFRREYSSLITIRQKYRALYLNMFMIISRWIYPEIRCFR